MRLIWTCLPPLFAGFHVRAAAMVLGGATAAVAGVVAAQEYPAKPVRLIVPYAPGGGLDVLARPLTQKLFESWGQPVLIDNRPGAGTTFGSAMVAKAPPDGYTLLLTLSALASGPGLYPNLPYDPLRDFAPVIWTATTSYVLAVHPSVPVKSVRDLLALARTKPGQLNYSSSGQGSDPHLAAEQFKLMTGIQLTHIPYSGGNPAAVALMGGQVDVSFMPTVMGTPFIKSGKMRGLAVSTPQRTPVFPDLPTIAEAGVPGYEAQAWSGLLAPAQTARDIVARLNSTIAKIMHTPEMTQYLLARQTIPKGSSVEEFTARLKYDVDSKTRLIRDARIKIE